MSITKSLITVAICFACLLAAPMVFPIVAPLFEKLAIIAFNYGSLGVAP